MYLYFNKEGELTTKIIHGEPLRQGNPINLYVCFPLGFFQEEENITEKWIVKVDFTRLDGSTAKNLVLDYIGPKIFYKLKDSEITYDLIDGKKYLTYHRLIDGVTNIPGNLIFNVNVRNVDDELNNYQESFNGFVEKTIGLEKPGVTVSPSQFVLLQKEHDRINAKIENIRSKPYVYSVSALPHIITDHESENYNLEEFWGYLFILNGEYQNVEELPIKETDSFSTNLAYKYQNKYYRISRVLNPETDTYNYYEITDFEETVGRIYKLDSLGMWEFINRDIREVIGKETDETDQTLFGLKKNLIKYVDDNFPKYITEPNMVYGTNSEGNTVPIPHDELKPNIILRYEHFNFFPTAGEIGKFYISEYDSVMYYWDGIKYQRISNGDEDFDVIDGGNADEYEYDSDIIDGGEA